MAERDLSERERRELADAHRGEVVVDSGEPVEPRRLGQMVSLRLETETITALRDIANRRGVTLSDLLREGAGMVIAAAEPAWQIMDLTYKVSWIDPGSPSQVYARYTTSPVRLDQDLSATA